MLKFLKTFWPGVQLQVSWDFFISLAGWPMLAILVWHFDLPDGLFQQIVVTLLYSVIPVLLLVGTPGSSPQLHLPAWGIRGLVLLFLGILLFQISDQLNFSELRNAIMVVLVTAPFLWIFGVLIRRKPLLGVALTPAMIVAMIYLGLEVLPAGQRLNLLLIPLPLVLLSALAWALLAWPVLIGAERWRRVVLWGPAMEAIAMFVLFLPLILLAIMVPQGLSLGQTWLTASVTIVGVLFSSIVSVPLRQFLLDLGNMPPNGRWEG